MFYLKICEVLTNDAGGRDTHCKLISVHHPVFCIDFSIKGQCSISGVSIQFCSSHFKRILLNPDVGLLGVLLWLYSCSWILHHFVWDSWWMNRHRSRFFSPGLVSFLCLFMNPTFFPAHVSLCVYLVCGSTLSPPQLSTFGLHFLMKLCYSRTSLFDF